MYCELIFALVVLLIDIPLSLSLGYQSQMYSMHDPNLNSCLKIFINSQFSCFLKRYSKKNFAVINKKGYLIKKTYIFKKQNISLVCTYDIIFKL